VVIDLLVVGMKDEPLGGLMLRGLFLCGVGQKMQKKKMAAIRIV